MDKREVVKEIFIAVSKKYLNNFNSSIDTTIYNLSDEVRNQLTADHNNDPEISDIFNSVMCYIVQSIRNYAISLFDENSLNNIFKNFDQYNKMELDKKFLSYVKYKTENNLYINPIEKRFKELLDEKINSKQENDT
jgi:hypothetical protein